MALAHNLLTLSNVTPTLVDTNTTSTNSLGETTYGWNIGTFSIQNVDTSAIVYLGSSTVTSSSYGYKLAPGSSISIDLGSTALLYAISNTNATSLAVLSVVA